MKKIVINTVGGDAPGLNTVIRAIVLSAIQRGWISFIQLQKLVNE
jgi:6-phosphofructokinase 1